MDKREIETSLATGYTLTVGTSENASLPTGRSFDTVEAFETALRAARSAVGHAPYTKVDFVLRTRDGLVSYAGRYDLEASETPDVFAHVMEVADHSLAFAPLLQDVDARLNTKIRALSCKVLFAVIARTESDHRIALIQAELAVLSGTVSTQA